MTTDSRSAARCSSPGSFAMRPLAAALLVSAALVQPVLAADRMWFGGNGDWDVDTNWSPVGVPGSGDTAIIDAGTSALSFAETIAGFRLNGGMLTGGGTLGITGDSTWTGGSMRGDGTTQFDGDLLITGAQDKELGFGRTLITNATTTWSGNAAADENRILLSSTSTINNTGTWNDENTFDTRMVRGVSGLRTFNNSGVYNKIGNSTTTLFTGFSNTGTVNVLAGVLNLNDGGGALSTGTFNIAAGATLALGNTTNTGTSGAQTLSSATFTGTGTLVVGGSSNSSTDVVIEGTSEHAGHFSVIGNTVAVNGNLTVGSFSQSGGILGGTGVTRITGGATWTGGSMRGDGTTQFDGDLLITGAQDKELGFGRKLITNATTTWSGNAAADENRILLSSTSTINNTGTWNDENTFDTRMVRGVSGLRVFNNSGVYNKIGNSTTTLETPLENTGLVDIQRGVLAVTARVVNQGTIQGRGTLDVTAAGLDNHGEINPGSSVGHLTIAGDVDLSETSELNFELMSAADFDVLTVTGDVALDGTIAIRNLGYSPVLGDSFIVMTFAQSVGQPEFDSEIWTGFGPGVAFDVIYNTDNITLSVVAVPEPSTYLMMALGLGLVGMAAHRRRRPLRD